MAVFLRHRKLYAISSLMAILLVVAGCGGSPVKKDDVAASPAASTQVAAPQAPASQPVASAPLVIIDSVVRGSKNLPASERAEKTCVPNSRFKRNEELVWRIKVLDPVTGKNLSDQDLALVQVELADGKTFKAAWGERPKNNPTDAFWGAGWEIPEGYPAGRLNYTIVAETKDGRKGTFVSFNVASSALYILDESIPKVVATTQ